MNHSTYKRLYRAHLGVVDEKGLLQSQSEETDPFYKNALKMVVEHQSVPKVEWDTKPFTKEFRSASPRQRLDETFFAFVLKAFNAVRYQSYLRAYRKPESHQAVLAWISIFRNILYTGLGLLYNVKWTDESIMKQLDPTVTKLFAEGNVAVIRTLMVNLGIDLFQEEPYQAERHFAKMNFLYTIQFGSFIWRYLHWMAEAVSLRNDDANKYKSEWLNLLKGPFYRILQCGYCMEHFKLFVVEYDKEFNYENFPQVFFKMHNRVNAIKRDNHKYTGIVLEPDYTESQYAADSEFMRQALLA